jgi:hypothetical protein
LRKLSLFFEFYKRHFALQLLFPLLIHYMKSSNGLTYLTFLAFSLLVWGYNYFLDDPKREKLHYFFNFGFTELQLHGFTFILNLILLILILPFL